MKEDNGKYKCVAKRGMLDSSLMSGIDYVVKAEELDPSIVANLTGDALAEQADILFDNYWRKHFLQGSTCDFGGVAQLEELNYTCKNVSFRYIYIFVECIYQVTHGLLLYTT